MKKKNAIIPYYCSFKLFRRNPSFLLVFYLIFSGSIAHTARAQKSVGKLIAGGDEQVIIVDYKAPNLPPKVVWTWNGAEETSNKFSKIVDCKSINNGKRILVISGNGAFAILNRLNKQVVFQSEVPHLKSAEQLPKGYVMTISTQAGQYTTNLFHLHKGPQPIYSDSTLRAEALAWDELRKQIWVAGDQKLRQLKVTKHNKLEIQKEWKLPVPLEENSEMVTEGDYLYIKGKQNTMAFNLDTFSFSDQSKLKVPHPSVDAQTDSPVELSQLPSYEKLLLAPIMTYRFQNMTINRVRKF